MTDIAVGFCVLGALLTLYIVAATRRSRDDASRPSSERPSGGDRSVS